MSLEKADELFEAKQYKEAAVEYRAALEASQDDVNPSVYSNLAQCF